MLLYFHLLHLVISACLITSATASDDQAVFQASFANDPSQLQMSDMPPSPLSPIATAALNVLKRPLAQLTPPSASTSPSAAGSIQPTTGFLRNGYCETPSGDYGNHAIAAQVSKEFLEFSAAKGNDLRVIPGMVDGCKWCLCTSRWLEAFNARGTEGDKVVPRVFLDATNESALKKVDLETLKQFAVEGSEPK